MTPGMPVSCLSGEPLSVGAVFHWVVTLIWYGLPPGGFEDGVASLSVPPLFGGFYAVLVEFSPLTPHSSDTESAIRFRRRASVLAQDDLPVIKVADFQLASLKWSTVSYHPRTTYPACTA
jgi:hypothetical protein